MESFISTDIFPKNKIMFQDAKGRAQKRKKKKASESSTVEEHMEIESEDAPASPPENVPAKRLGKESAKKVELVEQEAENKKRRAQQLMKVKKETGERQKAREEEQRKNN